MSISSKRDAVTVTDVKIPFWSMVFLMVKWVIASIPAMIILYLLFVFVVSVFGVALLGGVSLLGSIPEGP